jgi:hypothetical protein
MREKTLEINDNLEIFFDETNTASKFIYLRTINNELMGVDVSFIIKGFHYRLISTKNQNEIFNILIRQSDSNDVIFRMKYEELKIKNAEEICYEIEKEIKKIKMKAIFKNGAFRQLKKLVNHSKFKNINVDIEKLKKELKDKLNLKNNEHLELILSSSWAIEYERNEEIFCLNFYYFKEQRKIQIKLLDIVNN